MKRFLSFDTAKLQNVAPSSKLPCAKHLVKLMQLTVP